ncbi:MULTISPECIES: HAD family hydrolase [unclassified Arthrobacter]|uniref:HAD family hydrolase n=1 Tax=unclassified Arthrobacter TaxID=235627 RepID=UPI00031E8576|nr:MULTISPECIES: HAD family phosphatase [unclassified Arthrobacter]PVE17887.1 HAD family phosphatase [Arthrobacter sp. Bz4]
MGKTQWYLFDYGMVISNAPTPEDWLNLEDAAGVQLMDPGSPYWQHRLDFDAGRKTSVEYWSLVTGRDVTESRTDLLDTLDANQWSHFNLETLDVLEELSSQGARLALLSNMPAPMVARFEQASWTGYFTKMYFSSVLQLVKPQREIFEHVLRDLGAEPHEVTFVDDAQVNVAAAQELGIDAMLHQPGIDLQRELFAPR